MKPRHGMWHAFRLRQGYVEQVCVLLSSALPTADGRRWARIVGIQKNVSLSAVSSELVRQRSECYSTVMSHSEAAGAGARSVAMCMEKQRRRGQLNRTDGWMVILLSFLATVAIAVAQTGPIVRVPAETKTVIKPVDKGRPRQTPIPHSLGQLPEQASASVRLAPVDIEALLREDRAGQGPDKGPRRIGVKRALSAPIKHADADAPPWHWAPARDGGHVWTLLIESAEAKAIRVHVEDLRLPDGCLLLAYNTDDPTDAVGPYDTKRLTGRNEFWTESVFGSRVTLECYARPGSDPNAVRLTVKELVHVYVDVRVLAIPKEGGCHNDVTCWPLWDSEARATARWRVWSPPSGVSRPSHTTRGAPRGGNVPAPRSTSETAGRSRAVARNAPCSGGICSRGTSP